MTARWHSALHPSRLGTVPQLVAVVKAVCILDNMVTVERREGFVSQTRRGYGQGAPGSGVPAECGGGTEGAGSEAGAAAAAAGVGGPGGGARADLGPAAGLGGGGALPALEAPAPVMLPIAQSPHVRAMRAWREVRSAREHAALRNDLTKHVWEERGELLALYL